MGLEEKFAAYASGFAGVKKVALSYSGGLDSNAIGTLLSEAGLEVLPVAIDLGQSGSLPSAAKSAKASFGACVQFDAKERLSDGIIRAVKSGYGFDAHFSAGGIVRPAMAFALAHTARAEGCQAIAHGSSGLGNDHLTLENALRVLAPEMRIMAPVRDLDLKRDETVEYAVKKGLPKAKEAAKYSADESLWQRAIRQGGATDPSSPLPEDAYEWTVSPKKAPDKSASVEVEFENGIPTKASSDGKVASGLLAIVSLLNSVGGKHGVGRTDGLDDKVVGLKVREAYEWPAARILLTAHRELERLTLTSKELDAKRYVEALWGRLVHDGGWHTRLRHSLDAFIDETQRAVDGSVSLELYKGSIIVKGRKSPNALYDTRLSARDSKGVFSQDEARHYAKLYGLQDVIAYLVDVD